MAPDFELSTADGKKFKLSSFKGKKPVVAFFYPADSTPGCTKEACQFELDGPKFKKLGAEVVGISAQGADSKKKFIAENNLSMPLLIDAGDKVSAVCCGLCRPCRLCCKLSCSSPPHPFLSTPTVAGEVTVGCTQGSVWRAARPCHLRHRQDRQVHQRD